MCYHYPVKAYFLKHCCCFFFFQTLVVGSGFFFVCWLVVVVFCFALFFFQSQFFFSWTAAGLSCRQQKTAPALAFSALVLSSYGFLGAGHGNTWCICSEIEAVIKNLPTNDNPRTDGTTGEFYLCRRTSMNLFIKWSHQTEK